MVFALLLPYPTVFFPSVQEIASRHCDQRANGEKTINVLFVNHSKIRKLLLKFQLIVLSLRLISSIWSFLQ